MLFNSYIFIFLFLPLCLAGFYLLEKHKKAVPARLWLTGFSLWFYGYFNLTYLLIMICSILANYAFFVGIKRLERCGRRWSRLVMALGVAGNLAVLFYFKYYDFFIETLNRIFRADFVVRGILLPLGISFFTFQQIGFLVDAYQGELDACPFVDYMLFVSFFPQLIAGPIVSQDEMLPQFAAIGNRKVDWQKLRSGTVLFVLGMAKKVLVADTFGQAVDWAYANTASLSSVDAALTILFYTLQLYYDFSGYCNMARGLGWMLGIDIPKNFDSPYKSADIIEFWRRWHITLGRFFRKYVYIPLGGNRRGRTRMYLNMFLVFFLSGIWHGAGWTFLIWGLAQGVLYLITRALQLWKKDRAQAQIHRRRPDEDAPRPVWKTRISKVTGTAFTFLFYNLICVFFRAENLPQALTVFDRLANGGITLPAEPITAAFNLDELWYAIKLLRLDALPYSACYLMVIITAATLTATFAAPNADQMTERFKGKTWNAILTAILAAWCVLSLGGVERFLYFNF